MFSKLELATPVGALIVVARGEALCQVAFPNQREDAFARLEERFGSIDFSGPFPKRIESRLRAYLSGELDAMEGLPVDVAGTPFQMRVWNALRTIPPGETISYRELADRAGARGAMRAVGNANGRNPVGVVIPCHRVIHADGTIGGYGGGVPRKRWLLEHERAYPNASLALQA